MKCFKSLTIIFISLMFGSTVIAKEKVTLAYMDFPPYECRENGEAKGVMVEIVQKVFAKTNLQLTLQFSTFKDAYREVKSGKINGLFNLYKTEEREKIFDYSEVVISSPIVFFVLKSNAKKYNFVSTEDLAWLRIGILKDYNYGPDLWENPMFISDESNSHTANFYKLGIKRIHLYPCDKLIGIYIAKKHDIVPKVAVLKNPLYMVDGYVGFTKKSNQHIINQINPVIQEMWKNGEMETIINKYLAAIPPVVPLNINY